MSLTGDAADRYVRCNAWPNGAATAGLMGETDRRIRQFPRVYRRRSSFTARRSQLDRLTDDGSWITTFDPIDPGTKAALDDVAFQRCSSGTTGRPEGVMLANASFLRVLAAARDPWELSSETMSMSSVIATRSW